MRVGGQIVAKLLCEPDRNGGAIGRVFPDGIAGISTFVAKSVALMIDAFHEGVCLLAAALRALSSRSRSAILISKPRSVGR